MATSLRSAASRGTRDGNAALVSSLPHNQPFLSRQDHKPTWRENPYRGQCRTAARWSSRHHPPRPEMHPCQAPCHRSTPPADPSRRWGARSPCPAPPRVMDSDRSLPGKLCRYPWFTNGPDESHHIKNIATGGHAYGDLHEVEVGSGGAEAGLMCLGHHPGRHPPYIASGLGA